MHPPSPRPPSSTRKGPVCFSWPNFSPGRVSHSLWAVVRLALPLPFVIFRLSQTLVLVIHSFSLSLVLCVFESSANFFLPLSSHHLFCEKKWAIPLTYRHKRTPPRSVPSPINGGKVKKKQSEERGPSQAGKHPHTSRSFEPGRPLATLSSRLRQLLSFWPSPCRFQSADH